MTGTSLCVLALLLSLNLFADERLSGFVQIPKNPGFVFANGLQERTPGRRAEAKAVAPAAAATLSDSASRQRS